MDLLLLDKDFKICGIIDDFASLVWNRKYYECGNFTLQTKLDKYNDIKIAKYIYCKDFVETGVIEAIKIQESTQIVETSGRFLESILAKRVINTTKKFSDTITEDIVRSLITDIAINDTNRKIDKLVLGTRQGLGTSRTMQMTGDVLLEKIYELCKEDELGFRVRYDFDNDNLLVEVWQGSDRVDTQTINTWAIFSKNFENITDSEYNIDSTQYRNYAYVEGELSDQEGNKTRVSTIVDIRKDGEELIELYVDARDLQKDEETSNSEYMEMLEERGKEKLAENNKVEEASFAIDPYSNLKYKIDFDLGDKVVYKNDELGFNIENRIVGISEAYENGNKTIDVTFGDEYNLKKIKEVI